MGQGPQEERPASALSITVWDTGHAEPRHWSLTCDPPAGDHPDPVAACEALSRVADPFAPVPPGSVCAQVIAGPQRAAISGIWRGQRVDAGYSRNDSCQEQRWQALAEVFGTGRRR